MTDAQPNGGLLGPVQKNAFEWGVFALGFALVAAVVGYLGYAAFTDTEAPPRFEITLGAPEATPHGRRVPVTLRNAGAETVASAVVEVTDGAHTGEVTFGYVPRHATREGAAYLDTVAGPLRARVTGYEAP